MKNNLTKLLDASLAYHYDSQDEVRVQPNSAEADLRKLAKQVIGLVELLGKDQHFMRVLIKQRIGFYRISADDAFVDDLVNRLLESGFGRRG